LDISPTDIGTLNYTFSQPFLALPKSNVTLYCSSEDLGSNSDYWSGDISTVLIPNVTCLPNQRTILTGNLFGGEVTLLIMVFTLLPIPAGTEPLSPNHFNNKRLKFCVTVNKNVTKIYSGNLFGTPTNGSGFQVTIDPGWGTDPSNNQNF
jgi:hypothetical protein